MTRLGADDTRRSGLHGPDEVARRFGGDERARGKRTSKACSNQQQLRTFEAVETDVALEIAVHPETRGLDGTGTDFAGEQSDDLQQAAGDVVAGRGNGHARPERCSAVYRR